MNAVEIEEAVSQLASAPFDAAEFPFAFLAAFGNKEATLRRLRTGNTNKSDVGGVLQRNNIHLAIGEPGKTVETLAQLRAQPPDRAAEGQVRPSDRRRAAGGGGDRLRRCPLLPL